MVATPYPIVDVSGWPIANLEPRGGGPNTWLYSAIERGHIERWLFKPVSTVSWGHQDEDWAEKITCEIARLVGVPCADIEVAQRHSQRGIISRDLAPPPWELQTGSVVLSGLLHDYRPGSENLRGRPGHSLRTSGLRWLVRARPRAAFALTSWGAFGVFAGYLVLDALVANRDRHDENWAVLRPELLDARDLLCPSYDHGSSLGFNLMISKQEIYLSENKIQWWAGRGDAYRFEHFPPAKPPTLVEHAREGLQFAGKPARTFWLDQLQHITRSDVCAVVDRMPELSDVTRTFIVELLVVNRRRLLDAC
jgi:hypothetical protein